MWKISKILSWFFVFSSICIAEEFSDKTVIYINSYHQGSPWSDGIEHAIRDTFKNTGIRLHVFYMDTKRRVSDESKRTMAFNLKAKIEQIKPDLVITSDDDPARYLIMPYFKDADIPFVFCGINWDATAYGFPYHNVTGMLEISHLEETIKALLPYAKGKRIGFLSSEGLTERKQYAGYEERFQLHFSQAHFVRTFEEWKQIFLLLQQQVDVLILENPHVVTGWDAQLAQEFIERNVQIPIGATHDWLIPFVTLGIMKDAREQGEWSAQTALKILSGTTVDEIPITINQHDKLYLNQRIAQKLGIIFSTELQKKAYHVFPQQVLKH